MELTRRAASLSSEVEKANAQRNELQTKLDQAISEITSAQSQLEDKQPRLGGTESEPENAKQTADQAKAQDADLAKRAASLNSELEKANAQSYLVDLGNAGRQSVPRSLLCLPDGARQYCLGAEMVPGRPGCSPSWRRPLG